MFIKLEANNCFILNTQVVAWRKYKKSQKIQYIHFFLQAACETNVKIVFYDKTKFISILQQRYYLKLFENLFSLKLDLFV